MNNFNRVFLSIKKHCAKEKHIAEINCFDDIARDVNIPLTKLPLYLNHLQDIGVIRYSMSEKYIHLTALGRKYDTLVTE